MYGIGHVPIKKWCTLNGVRYFVFSIITRNGTEYLKVHSDTDGAETIPIGVDDVVEWEDPLDNLEVGMTDIDTGIL